MNVAGRVAAATLLTGGILLGTAGAAPAEVSLQAQTAATAVHVSVTQRPASSIITASLFDDAVAYAAADYDSGGSSEALAAPAFPGRLVVQGPQLLCSELFSCPTTPPAYPLLADASYPRRQHDTATASGQPTGSGPFVVTPLSATATANANNNNASTAGAKTTLLAGTAGAVTVGASAATSKVTGAGRGVQVQVTSTVSDISIAGLVHIANIAARDDISVSAGASPVDKPTITVSGVTVAGQTASIDERGIHLPGADGPSVNQRLDQAGVSVRLVGTHHADTHNGARSDATALEIDVAVPISGVPYIPNPLPTLPPPFDQVPQLPGVDANGTYVAQVTLGAVGAAAGFGVEPTLDLGGFGVVPTPRAATGSSSSSSSTASAPGSTGSQLGGGAGAVPAAPPQVAPQASGIRGFLDGFSSGDIETLYAVLALGVAVLFIGWRAAAVVRRGLLRAGRRR
jgi:hypothetical protein